MAGVLGGRPIRGNPASPFHHVDFALLVATVALSGMGLLMVFSATQHKLAAGGYDLHLYLKRSWALARAWGDAAWHRRRVARAIL